MPSPKQSGFSVLAMLLRFKEIKRINVGRMGLPLFLTTEKTGFLRKVPVLKITG